MKLKQSMEEAICILLFLASSDENHPVNSAAISQMLGVSDSYLKKIMRKLVLADMVVSTPGKGGGFHLRRQLNQVSFLDVYYSIEGKDSYVHFNHLTDKLFDSPLAGQRVQEKMHYFFSESERILHEKLAAHSLSELLESPD